MRLIMKTALVGLLAALAPSVARAHGTFHELISAANARIAAEPRSAEAHLQRGDLYRAHGDAEAALADYDKIRELAPDHDVDILKAQIYLDQQRLMIARTHIDRSVKAHPQNPHGRLIRARVYSGLRNHGVALREYREAWSRTPTPAPDHVLEFARACEAAGKPVEALRVLDDGMQKLGRIVTLQLAAIEIERKARRWDAALARVEELAAPSPRKETWLFRRGEILLEAGRRKEAQAAFTAALAAIDGLPAHLRGTRAMAELGDQTRAALVRARGSARR